MLTYLTISNNQFLSRRAKNLSLKCGHSSRLAVSLKLQETRNAKRLRLALKVPLARVFFFFLILCFS